LKKIIGILAGVFCLAAIVSAQTPTPEKTVTPNQPKVKRSIPHKKSKIQAKPTAKLAPNPSTDSVKTAVSVPTPVVPNDWTKEWKKKYIIVTPKEGYTHVLIDVATLKEIFSGPSAHAAAALETLYLSQSDILDPQAPDTVKCDVVIFEGRDNYDSPLWDTMKRIGRLEFSRKALAQSSPALFTQAETAWNNQFLKVLFY
jgi:hypothetical protein